MDPVAPLSPPVLVAVLVALSYLILGVIWRRPEWIVGYPRTVLALLGAVSLAAAFALFDFSARDARVHLDASEEPLMVRGDPAREVYRRATQAFGNDDVFVIAMVTDDVFTPDNLAALRRISRQVLHLPGVRRAESLVDILAYRFDPAEDWIDVARFIGDEIPDDPARLADLRARALADPIYPKLVVSRDGSAAAINVSFDEISDREFVDRGLDEKIRAIAEAEATPSRSFHFAGRPHVKSRTATIMARDLLRLIPLAVVVAAVVVFFTTG